jgi:hypothetical protein
VRLTSGSALGASPGDVTPLCERLEQLYGPMWQALLDHDEALDAVSEYGGGNSWPPTWSMWPARIHFCAAAGMLLSGEIISTRRRYRHQIWRQIQFNTPGGLLMPPPRAYLEKQAVTLLLWKWRPSFSIQGTS